ncbi:MAG: Ribonucleoside-diphosphate reductase [Berkelbacteria bacterium GW2011_GWA2_35_9]|uniref:Vitamin B12-dependent ribonucleotide reductase n=1 Tax=Berkelbacteria bacterium GW2011_GWA2_35_9 TaxID=1618333 RepID=A0A0G0GBW4_9BACT|nr:MAG: Ribonucleoside-diphosphate reductase [Berkelbacteria bacterium GW2011_GWA2_35_9]
MNNSDFGLKPIEIVSKNNKGFNNKPTTIKQNPAPQIDPHLNLNRKPDFKLDIIGSTELGELGEKIFLDRYALKDASKTNLNVGDKAIVCVDINTRQKEIGHIEKFLTNSKVSIKLYDGTMVESEITDIDIPSETIPDQMLDRISQGVSKVEKTKELQVSWQKKFRWLLDDWKFVPAGRILAAAGTNQKLTYYNCYVIPSPRDSREGIIKTLGIMTEIFSRGGGVGINISTLRPKHAYVKGVNGRSSGSVSWGALYSFATGLIEQGGSRRGALMLMLNDWHPDVYDFIDSKRVAGKINNANISVAVSDKFMDQLKKDGDWQLKFPDFSEEKYNKEWNGDIDEWEKNGGKVKIYKTIKAREMWDKIIGSAWASAEPGLFFIERTNKMSNSYYFANIIGTNPCGEQGLPGFGVCNLGAINLAKFYNKETQDVDWKRLEIAAQYSTRFLDNIIDATPYFMDENKTQQQGERRVGLNTMGLAELLIKKKIRYGSQESLDFIDKLYRFLTTIVYKASIGLAIEKGAFPQFIAEKHIESGFMKAMPQEIRDLVVKYGIRNVTLLTQAPNGTTGTMVGTSTGIEPFYSWVYQRKSRLGIHDEQVAVYEDWKRNHKDEKLPDYFTTAMDMTPEDHVRVQAAIQKWVDSSISKTCNTPNNYTLEDTKKLYELLYDLGCKGGTIYRDGSRDEQILSLKKDDKEVKTTVDEKPIRPRPETLHGATVSKKTPTGTAFVTMNDDEKGNPFEVFVEIGKAGSDIKAMAEALGRLISLFLRLSSNVTGDERIRYIINQLHSIGGSNSIGFGKNRVMSLPDAISQVLESHYNISNGSDNPTAHQASLISTGKLSQSKTSSDLCPSCGQATYQRIEGCKLCLSCGHSECG